MRGTAYKPHKGATTRSRIPSSSQGGSLDGIQISLNVMSLGTLRNYQEQTVMTIQVRLFEVVLHF